MWRLPLWVETKGAIGVYVLPTVGTIERTYTPLCPLFQPTVADVHALWVNHAGVNGPTAHSMLGHSGPGTSSLAAITATLLCPHLTYDRLLTACNAAAVPESSSVCCISVRM